MLAGRMRRTTPVTPSSRTQNPTGRISAGRGLARPGGADEPVTQEPKPVDTGCRLSPARGSAREREEPKGEDYDAAVGRGGRRVAGWARDGGKPGAGGRARGCCRAFHAAAARTRLRTWR